MASFNFVARNNEGKRISGSEDAQSADELIARLQSRGLIVITVKQRTVSFGAKPATNKPKRSRFTHSGIKIVDLANMARQLSTMVAAGVSAVKSLEVIEQQCESKRLDRILVAIIEDVRSGSPLHKAFSKHVEVFNALWVHLIETGEASGNLANVLDRLAYYLEVRDDFKRKIISALVYPMIVLFGAIAAVGIFVLVILPVFADLYKNLGSELPGLTKSVLQISIFAKKFFIPLAIVMAVLVFLARKYLKTPEGKHQFDTVLLKMPIFGDIMSKLEIERFTSTMSILVESGVPILYSLEIAERACSNSLIAAVLNHVKEEVRKGKILAEPLSKSDLFPPMVVSMISIGEEIGELPQMLKRLSEYYAKLVETFVTRLGAVVEPILLVIVGSVICFLLVAMFLPIFNLASAGAGAAKGM